MTRTSLPLSLPNPMAISFLLLFGALLMAASTADASPRLVSSSFNRFRGSYQGIGGQKGQRTTRGFKNHELSVARGFGKRSDENGVEEGPPKGRWMGFGGVNGGRGDEGEMEDEGRRELNAFPMQFAPGSRFPVQWLAEEVAGNPALAQLLIRRFVDEDGDGEVTAEEMLRPYSQ